MPRVMKCPYFKFYRERCVSCEAGTLHLPSREAWDEYTREFCCDVSAWKRCTLAAAMGREYERKEKRNHGPNRG